MTSRGSHLRLDRSNMTPARIDRHRVAREFGAALRAIRRERGLTQEEIADRADFDRTYPSLIERGLRTPTITVLLKLAEALQIEPAELINRLIERLAGKEEEYTALRLRK
jgi:transcriptional regulator with XRE-family HTH domain